MLAHALVPAASAIRRIVREMGAHSTLATPRTPAVGPSSESSTKHQSLPSSLRRRGSLCRMRCLLLRTMDGKVLSIDESRLMGVAMTNHTLTTVTPRRNLGETSRPYFGAYITRTAPGAEAKNGRINHRVTLVGNEAHSMEYMSAE